MYPHLGSLLVTDVTHIKVRQSQATLEMSLIMVAGLHAHNMYHNITFHNILKRKYHSTSALIVLTSIMNLIPCFFSDNCSPKFSNNGLPGVFFTPRVFLACVKGP